MRKLIIGRFFVVMAMLTTLAMVSMLSSCKRQPTDSKVQSFNPQVDGIAVTPITPLDIDKARQILNKVENTAAPAATSPGIVTPATNIPSATEPNMPPKNTPSEPNTL